MWVVWRQPITPGRWGGRQWAHEGSRAGELHKQNPAGHAPQAQERQTARGPGAQPLRLGCEQGSLLPYLAGMANSPSKSQDSRACPREAEVRFAASNPTLALSDLHVHPRAATCRGAARIFPSCLPLTQGFAFWVSTSRNTEAGKPQTGATQPGFIFWQRDTGPVASTLRASVYPSVKRDRSSCSKDRAGSRLPSA